MGMSTLVILRKTCFQTKTWGFFGYNEKKILFPLNNIFITKCIFFRPLNVKKTQINCAFCFFLNYYRQTRGSQLRKSGPKLNQLIKIVQYKTFRLKNWDTWWKVKIRDYRYYFRNWGKFLFVLCSEFLHNIECTNRECWNLTRQYSGPLWSAFDFILRQKGQLGSIRFGIGLEKLKQEKNAYFEICEITVPTSYAKLQNYTLFWKYLCKENHPCITH